MPREKYDRDSALPDLSASAPVVGPLYENPTYTNLSPRLGVAWDVFGNGRTAVRGGYGLYFNTNNHQNLIVTVTNPPFTPRPVIVNPTFPNPPFDRASAISMRPVQYDLDNPRVHVYNANVQQEVWGRTAVTIGYAGSRGKHLLRSGDVNLAQPTGTTADGRPFIAAGTPRINPAFSTIELKSSDGDSWYNALIFEVRRRWSQGPFAAVVVHVLEERGHHAGLDVLLRRDQRHHVGAARVRARLQPRAVRLRHPPQLGHELHRGAARAGHDRRRRRDSRRLEPLRHLDDAQRQSADGVRDHQPLALAVESVARTRASVRIGPTTRPAMVPTTPCSAGPSSGSTRRRSRSSPPAPSATPAAATSPGRTCARSTLALSKSVPWARLGGRVEVRLEAFNVLNRTNFGVPELRAFSGTEGQPVLATFGRITNTVTSSRQIQLGVRVVF